jgi:hypothetical protein
MIKRHRRKRNVGTGKIELNTQRMKETRVMQHIRKGNKKI